MNERNLRGVESSHNGVEVKTNSRAKDYLKRMAGRIGSSVAAIMAFSGGISEAKADTGTVDDIYRLADLTSNQPNADFPVLDMENSAFTREPNIANGGEVELNSTYKAVIDNNNKTFNIVNRSTNQIVESFTSQNSLNFVSPVVSLGQGYVVVNGSPKAKLFNINSIGTPNFTFTDLNRIIYGFPTNLVKHPQTGDVVGVTLSGAANEAVFFSYASGTFMPTHPVANEYSKVEAALKSVGIMDANGVLISTPKSSAVMPNGDIYFSYLDSSGNMQQWINPESDEVVVPTPVISAPSDFSMNVEDLLNGKSLDANVSDVPANGVVKVIAGGVEFTLDEVSSGSYSKVFTLQDLQQISNGEYDGIAEMRVEGQDGTVLASADMDISIDVVAPESVSFDIEGAVIESMNGVEISVVESEEIPAEITLTWMDGALDGLASARVAVASIPLFPGTTMEEFAGFTYEQKLNYVMSSVEMEEGQEGTITMMGNLGYTKDIEDLSATSVDIQIGEGGHVIAMFAFDEAGNIGVNIESLDVRKINNSDMTCEENPDQKKCDTNVEETCEENPAQVKCEAPVETCEENPDQEKCDANVEETCEENPTQDKCEVDSEKPVDKEKPQNSGENDDEEGGGCSTAPGKDAPADGGLALAALGMLGLAGAKKRRKRKIPKRKQ